MSDVPVQVEAPTPCGCGAGPHATNPDRCERGHLRPGAQASPGTQFAPGNQAARTDGTWRLRRDGTVPAELQQTIDDFRAGVIADRGGAENLTTIEAAYVRRLAEIEAVVRLVGAHLAAKGITTPKGRVRPAFNRWLEVLDRWDRYAQRLGMERRARDVSPIEAVRAAVAAANRREETESHE